MNRIEFMTELAALLQDVPAEERRDAMKYYNDYFDDAGEENEQKVIEELESPVKVAATIKADLEGSSKEYDEYTENVYQPKEEPPRTNGTLKIVLIILLIIVGAPIIIPIAITAVVLICVFAFLILLFLACLVIGSVAVAFAGVCVFIAGLLSLIPEIAVGLALIGTGLILAVLGTVGTVISVRICWIVLPGVIRGTVWLLRRPFQRRAVV